MSIQYIENLNCFKLDTLGSSYIIKLYEEGYLFHVYYGAKIPDEYFDTSIIKGYYNSIYPSNENLVHDRVSPDIIAMEYSGFNVGDYRPESIRIKNSFGNVATDLRYRSHTIMNGKPKLEGLPSLYITNDNQTQTLAIETVDTTTNVIVTLYYTVFEQYNAMTRHVVIQNNSKTPIEIEKIASACINLPTMNYDFIHLYGSWGSERHIERTPLHHGSQSIGSVRGTSSHMFQPFGAFASHTATEETGEVYGLNFVYSSNFLLEAHCDFYNTTRINLGIHPDGFGWLLNPKETFTAPEVVLVYSEHGLGEMSRTFHKLYNHHLIRGNYQYAKRPLLINSWEAAYFDFNTEKLVSFAKEAKKLGIEMLVMDDGWFGKRNNDKCSLGDWYVNEEKLSGGLGELIRQVNAEGLKFGIWYEPEMISPDSDLYRSHPDWCLQISNRARSISRSQYVLDMSRQDVRDNIFEQMANVLSKYPVDYVKWDFNRNLTEVSSALLPPERQKEIFHRFILGTYELMERITTAFPHILLENCSSGGGRFDAGMLYYSPQIWTSDNTDAIERLFIQYGTSLCYPASTMGAHVSFNSRTDFVTKGNVALWGSFGYELDPNRLSEEDCNLIRKQIADYHKYYDLIHTGDLYRLISPQEKSADQAPSCAWEFVSEDKSKALVTYVTILSNNNPYRMLKLQGLEPNKLYKEENSGNIYSGLALMKMGLNITDKPHHDGSSFTLYFTQI